MTWRRQHPPSSDARNPWTCCTVAVPIGPHSHWRELRLTRRATIASVSILPRKLTTRPQSRRRRVQHEKRSGSTAHDSAPGEDLSSLFLTATPLASLITIVLHIARRYTASLEAIVFAPSPSLCWIDVGAQLRCLRLLYHSYGWLLTWGVIARLP